MILVRGGGDLASGVIYRLYRAGIRVIVTELSKPLAVRRLVSFAETVYRGEINIEGIPARLVRSPEECIQSLEKLIVPVVIDPEAICRLALNPVVIVDARMTKSNQGYDPLPTPMLIGLGPGFTARKNCHAVIETNRGHFLGRVIWDGEAEQDTGVPEQVHAHRGDRVIRAPVDGKFVGVVDIGDQIQKGDLLAEVAGIPIVAPFDGVLRGIVHPGLIVRAGMKIGDLDPRGDPAYCFRISDKALAIGGGVLEAILSREEVRRRLWT